MPTDSQLVEDAIMRAGAYRRDLVTLMEELKASGNIDTREFEMLSRSYALVGNLSMHLGDLLTYVS